MKKIYKRVLVWVIVVLSLYGIYYSEPIQNFIFSCREFIEPDVTLRLDKEWQQKSDKFLIRQLMYSNNNYYPGLAADILCKRNKRELIPLFVTLANSNNDTRNKVAIYSLSYFGGEEAERTLMGIVEQGRKHRNYLRAVDALSTMHYDKIYPEILQMAKDSYHTSWVVDMLERFPEKPETLPALKKIAESDPQEYIRDKAMDAIKNLKSSTK